MKLYIKQKVFSWKDRFSIKGENNQDYFTVEGQVFSFGKKLHVYDACNQEVAYIEQKLLTFKPRYYIHIGSHVYEMVKDFTLFQSSYRLEGFPWKLEGNFTAHEFKLTNQQKTRMQVYREWFTWGDSYVLDFDDEEDMLLYLCMVLVVDCVLAVERQNH